MKHIYLISTILLICFGAHAQQKIEVNLEEKTMSQGQQMAVTVFIPEGKTKSIEPIWKNYINNRSIGERIGHLATQFGNIFRNEENKINQDKLKVEKKGDEWYVRSIEEADITSHSLDVYARASDLPDGCQFSAFFQYTDSVFINESNFDQERLQNLKSFIREFGIEAYKSIVDEQIKEAKKVVSDEESNLKKIESVSKREEKAITRYESDIDEYQSGINEIQNDISRLDESIGAKKLAFSLLLKGTPEYDVAKDDLKVLAKEKSKSFGKIKSLKGKIKSKEQNIKSSEKKISQNEVLITNQQKVIESKEAIVDQLQEKKEGIQ